MRLRSRLDSPGRSQMSGYRSVSVSSMSRGTTGRTSSRAGGTGAGSLMTPPWGPGPGSDLDAGSACNLAQARRLPHAHGALPHPCRPLRPPRVHLVRYDHVGNYALFPRATFYVQDAEMAFSTGRHAALPAFRPSVG